MDHTIEQLNYREGERERWREGEEKQEKAETWSPSFFLRMKRIKKKTKWRERVRERDS